MAAIPSCVVGQSSSRMPSVSRASPDRQNLHSGAFGQRGRGVENAGATACRNLTIGLDSIIAIIGMTPRVKK